VAARPLERHSIALAADAASGDVQPVAVDRHETIDDARALRTEKLLHATQIAETLFAHRADESDAARRADPGVAQGADDPEHHRQPAAVVGDARTGETWPAARHAHVGALRKDRVEMRAEHHVRPRPSPRPLPEHVADGVDAHVAQAQLFEESAIGLPSRLLLEGRRRNLAERDLLLLHPGLQRVSRCDGRSNGGDLQEPRANLVGLLLRHGR
jgi:hypothetical protein